MWKYTGNGWYPGIPARDLSDEEVRALGVEALLRASTTYERVPAADARPAATASAADKGKESSEG